MGNQVKLVHLDQRAIRAVLAKVDHRDLKDYRVLKDQLVFRE